MEQNKEVWVFDVCGTLYRSNTTFDFLDFFFKKRDSKKLKKLLAIRNKKSPFYWYRAILFKLFHIDRFRASAVGLMKGYEKQLIEAEASSFLEDVLEKVKIMESFDVLNDSKAAGFKVILASNSIEPVVRTIAEKLEVEYISTSLKVKDGKYTGAVLEEMTGAKHLKLKKAGVLDFNVVTDNYSDFQLVKQAKRKKVVIVNEEDKKFWDKLKPEYIQA